MTRNNRVYSTQVVREVRHQRAQNYLRSVSVDEVNRAAERLREKAAGNTQRPQRVHSPN